MVYIMYIRKQRRVTLSFLYLSLRRDENRASHCGIKGFSISKMLFASKTFLVYYYKIQDHPFRRCNFFNYQIYIKILSTNILQQIIAKPVLQDILNIQDSLKIFTSTNEFSIFLSARISTKTHLLTELDQKIHILKKCYEIMNER